MNISVIGIDIAKAVFYLVGIDEKGCVIYRVKVRRAQLLKTLANIPVCVVAMEACGSSNYWARQIGKLGLPEKFQFWFLVVCHEAVAEMRGGLSGPPVRRRYQTALSCGA